MGIITVSPESNYEVLFGMPIGTVVKVKGDYETVLRRVEESKPANRNFKLTPITAGTSMFTTYGPNHLVVSENSPI